MLGKDYDGQDCAVASALEVLGERWTLLIVRDAFFGVRRFSDFVTRLDVPRAVLSDRLRNLVDNGLMQKRDDPQHAGRVLYELTPAGKDLWPVLHALIGWGSKHRRRSSNSYRHARCDTELGPGAVCPTCGVAPLPEDVVKVPRRRRQRSRIDPVTFAMRGPRRLLEPVEPEAQRDRPLVHVGA